MRGEERVLEAVGAAIRSAGPIPALSVAYSGGIDSSVLLEALHRLAPSSGLAPLRALHVDHGLEADSVRWKAHCAEVCRTRAIAFSALEVDARPAPGESPEAAARDARYRALALALAPGEVLCVAHHADDQVVTVLLNLMRGAGPRGTAGMGAVRELGPGRLLRPLLAVRRRDIEAAACAWRLDWIEDPSNHRVRHPRNRLRAQVLPLLEAIEPGTVNSIARAARLHAQAARSVDDLARVDLDACRLGADDSISRAGLSALTERRRLAVLRLWMRDAGVRPPGEAHLREASRQLAEARRDRGPRIVWRDGELRAGPDHVVLSVGVPGAAPAAVAGAWAWTPGGTLDLPGGRLWAEPVSGSGLRAGAPLEVRVRSGGERCRPSGRAHSQTLKRLLQERGVPAWQRDALPLLYREGTLVAVADLWICAGYEASPGESGWRLHWKPSRP